MANGSQLPGDEIVTPGLDDLAHERMSTEALAVLAAAPRLRRVGVEVPTGFDEVGASLELYARLSDELGDRAHSRHHALMRRLVSYANSVRTLER